MGLDLLIRNGTIVDGFGAARDRGDVGIEGDRIVESGGIRLVQKAEGIAATVVNGEVTLENGQATGRVPGRLLRGPGARGHAS